PDDRVRAQPPGAIVSDLLTDFNDLIQKEIALAKGEFAENVTQKVAGVAWLAAGAFVLLLALLVGLAGLVLFIGSFGLALHWSAFAVAAGLLVIAAIVMVAGKSKMNGDLMPTRSIRQVNEDIKTVKEQMQ
ncbi:MAG TPA: phage holin family protein, partial [Beijerinckiaceae bacterium]